MSDQLDPLIIRTTLMWSAEFCATCVLKLFEQQEADEQQSHQVQHKNGVGFNKSDGTTLSYIAEKLRAEDPLSSTEIAVLHDLLPKYANQLANYLKEEDLP